MSGMLIVPTNVALLVLGELSDFHPDVLWNYLNTYPRVHAGSSLANIPAAFVIPDEVMQRIVQSLIDEPADSVQAPYGGLESISVRWPMVNRSDARALAHYDLHDCESEEPGNPESVGCSAISIQAAVLTDTASLSVELPGLVPALWDAMHHSFHALYPYHIDVAEETTYTRH